MDLHVFEEAGERFIFFPRSARLYELSETAAAIIAGVSDPGEIPENPAPTPVHAELRELLQRERQLEPPSPAPAADASPSFHTFSVYLAQTCNMSCCYCWNDGGSFGKTGHLMKGEQANGVTRLISSLAPSSGTEAVFVNFYGGEPLLNFPILKQIALDLRRAEARLRKTFYFTLDTNGTLLSGENAQFLAQHFSHIGVSIDGRREVHDFQRPGKGGERTWSVVVDNLAAFPRPEILGLRGTLTLLSDSYLETFRELSSLGVRRIQLEYCHEPHRENARYHKLVVPLERQLAELREFAADYVSGLSRYDDSAKIPFLSNLLDHVMKFRRGNRFTRPCGAGINTLAINSHGDIYPCIAFVDRGPFKMGQAASRCPLSLHRTLERFDVNRQGHCQDCWLRYDCGGGCYATHCDMTGSTCDPHDTYCAAMQGKARIYLHALARMQKECPWLLDPS